jgi:hypothetical protein
VRFGKFIENCSATVSPGGRWLAGRLDAHLRYLWAGPQNDHELSRLKWAPLMASADSASMTRQTPGSGNIRQYTVVACEFSADSKNYAECERLYIRGAFAPTSSGHIAGTV